MEDLLKLVKQCLSIVEDSNLKDNELNMLIEAAKNDLKRQGIKVEKSTENELIKVAICMFVKANFGMINIKDKEAAKNTYSLLCNNLSLSEEYKESGKNA